jgi:hypothetical protein
VGSHYDTPDSQRATPNELCTDPAHKGTPTYAKGRLDSDAEPRVFACCLICDRERMHDDGTPAHVDSAVRREHLGPYTPPQEQFAHGQPKTPVCTDPAHQDTPVLAFHGSDRKQCPLCGGERLSTADQRNAALGAIHLFEHFVQRALMGHTDELEIRSQLTDRVRAAIALDLEGNRGVQPWAGGYVSSVAAVAAVDTVVEFLKNPPIIIEHDDGRTEIRWA